MYRVAAICVLILSCAFTAAADQLIVNGGFESGLSGWTVTDAGGPGSFYANTGTITPLNGFPTVGANSGTGYAVTDQFGPGSHAISQSFTANGADHYSLTFSMFVNDWLGGGQFGGLVYLVDGAGDPLGGIGQVLYSADTGVTDGAPNPYVTETIDITGDLVGGNTYQLVFLESDQFAPISVGVDDVSLVVTPEPAGLMPLSLALLAAVVALRKRA